MEESDVLEYMLELSKVWDSDRLPHRLLEILEYSVAGRGSVLYEFSWRRSQEERGAQEGYDIFAHQKQRVDPVSIRIEEDAGISLCFERREVVHVEGALFFPVMEGRAVIQIVRLDWKDEDGIDFSLFERLIQFYNNLLVILRNKDQDYLTGLHNRESFNRIIGRICSSISDLGNGKTAARAYLAMLDIDHFKSVNDTYGHLIGDEVLVRFSQVLRGSIRREDFCFRYGGEEFIVIFLTDGPDEAEFFLERFRNNVESTSFPKVGKITVSIGYVKIRDSSDPYSLNDMADKALYHAKESGRNQVKSYDRLLNDGILQMEETQKSDISLWD